MKKIKRAIGISIGWMIIAFGTTTLPPDDKNFFTMRRLIATQAKGTQKVMVTKFFHLVNKTGAEVEIQALADGEELFVKRLDADSKSSPGIVHPADDAYPTLDLKISMNQQARQLEVKEALHLKTKRLFTISTSAERADAGFQIILNRDGIVVTQDYYPAR